MLSFEFGLLWPVFMGRFGDVFGIPFAIEGIFFFIEAIFIAIYIYGWKRLSGWAHFWTRRPGRRSPGIGGTFSVVAANAWMNQPAGFDLAADGRSPTVDPLEVIFNRATAYEVPHMILAAYLVTGFLLASVYAVGMLRGRRDRYLRLGLLIPLDRRRDRGPDPVRRRRHRGARDRRRPAGQVRGDGVHAEDRAPARDRVHRRLLHGRRGRRAASGSPDLDSFLAGFSTDTKVTGLDTIPPNDRPPANTMLHLAFDAMVGIGTALDRARALARPGPGGAGATSRRRRWFLRAVAVSGVAAIVALECGWIVTEVGRQPWIVYNVMRTKDARHRGRAGSG